MESCWEVSLGSIRRFVLFKVGANHQTYFFKHLSFVKPGGHLELFDRLDDADKWPGSIRRHSDFYLPSPDPKAVWRISDVLEGKQ